MNIYSVLDSDDEEKPKVKTQTKTEKPKEVKKAPFEAPVERDPKAGKKEHHTRHGAKDHHHPEGSSNPRKRQFDRKSGTGRGKEVAKGGAGGANWGNDKLEALKAEKHIAGDAEIPEETSDEPVVEAEPVEPEPTVFTLDEYQRRRAEQAKTNSEAFSAVKIREVSADFAGMKTKEDNNETDFIALGAAKAAKAKKDQRSTSKNVVLDVAFTAASTEQPERERRGGDRERGGDRGGRGRGGDRGDRPRSGRGDKARGEGRGGRGEPRAARAPRGPKVDVNDASAFPSL